MKYLKLFESFDMIGEISDLFIDFEELGIKPNIQFTKIVLDRNDWGGNFVSTKVRNIWGGDFIDYTEDTIMKKGDKKWLPTDSYNVRISKLNYIKKLTNKSIVEHWNKLDNDIRKRIPVIKDRAKRLGLELYGVHGTWLQLGTASHDDYIGRSYYGWDVISDCVVFAFIPIKKTNEGLFDLFKKSKVKELKIRGDLYEPIAIPYMVGYEDDHKTIPFTKMESDYIIGLAKHPSDVVYNNGPKFSANHFMLRLFSSNGQNKYFIIRKYSDEWFLVTVYDPKIKEYEKYKYYKCDTFDGVKELISNNI